VHEQYLGSQHTLPGGDAVRLVLQFLGCVVIALAYIYQSVLGEHGSRMARRIAAHGAMLTTIIVGYRQYSNSAVHGAYVALLLVLFSLFARRSHYCVADISMHFHSRLLSLSHTAQTRAENSWIALLFNAALLAGLVVGLYIKPEAKEDKTKAQ
jgi:hypothetical protein